MRTATVGKGHWKITSLDYARESYTLSAFTGRTPGELHRNLNEANFLAKFCSVVNVSLDFETVCSSAALALYEFFGFDYLGISFSATGSGQTLAYSSRPYMRGKRARSLNNEVSMGLKNGALSLSMLTPAELELVSGRYAAPTILELPGGLGVITMYSSRGLEGQLSDITRNTLLTAFSRAIRNALEHGKIRDLSMRDSLTGLYNRRVLDEMMVIEDRKRGKSDLAFILIDLDNFKSINDTHGHAAGDQVIVAVASILRENARGGDIVARYGGEEFAVLLPETTAEAARMVGERWRGLVEKAVIEVNGQTIRPTASLGVAYRSGRTARTMGDLANDADMALYRAKKAGKNRVCMAE